MWWAYNSYAAKASPRSPLVPSPASGVRAKPRRKVFGPMTLHADLRATRRPLVATALQLRGRRVTAWNRVARGAQEPARLGHLRRIAEPAPPAHDRDDERHGTPDQGEVVRQGRAAHVHEVERQPQRQQALDIGTLRTGAPDHRFPVGVVVQRAGARQAGADLQQPAMLGCVILVDDARVLGPRADDGHLAPQDIDELRELVDFGAAQPRAEPE